MTPKRTTPPSRERERERDPDEVNGLPPIKSLLFATKTVMYSAKKKNEERKRKKEEERRILFLFSDGNAADFTRALTKKL